MGFDVIRGEVVYDVRGILGVNDEHIFRANGRVYMIRELGSRPPLKVGGRYVNVDIVWSIHEHDGPMMLDLIVTREILPSDCSSEIRQRGQAGRNKLVRKLATIGKSHHDDKRKIEIDLSKLPQLYKDLYDHAFPYGIDLEAEAPMEIYDLLNGCNIEKEVMVQDGEEIDDENEGEVIDR